MFGDGRDTHLRLLCPGFWLPGSAPVQVVPQGEFVLSREVSESLGQLQPCVGCSHL